MLGYALFFTTIVALAIGAVLEGSLAFARVSARHAAEHYAELGLVQARSALLAGVAAQVQSGTGNLVAPSPLPAAPVCPSAENCAFTAAATFELAGTTAQPGGANVSASALQSYPAIGEQRLAATIVESVAARDGTPLATRTQDVTLRTFGVPPYAAIDGTSDAAATRDVASEADAAGCDPSNPMSCDATNPAPRSAPGDTRIHVLRRCVDGGSGACAGQTFVSADPTNAPASTPWFNANAQPGGWSR